MLDKGCRKGLQQSVAGLVQPAGLPRTHNLAAKLVAADIEPLAAVSSGTRRSTILC